MGNVAETWVTLVQRTAPTGFTTCRKNYTGSTYTRVLLLTGVSRGKIGPFSQDKYKDSGDSPKCSDETGPMIKEVLSYKDNSAMSA